MKGLQKTGRWTQIGWQGLQIPLLEDWHLARVQGDRNKGYLRVDDDEQVRMEIRWEKPSKRPEQFDRLADRMLRQLEKYSNRKKSAFVLNRDARIASPQGREFECFEAKGEISSYGCLMRCETCGRTVLARVSGTKRENIKTTARKIFEDMTDHPGEDGLDHWDAYGLKFALPPRYILQRTQMRTGALEMQFSDKKTYVDIRRLGLANILLKEHTLKNFFINYCFKELNAFNYTAAEVEVKGHEGLGLTGPNTLRSRLMSNVGGKRYVHAYAWICGNRIYILRMVTPRAEEPLFFEIADNIRCHEEEQAE